MKLWLANLIGFLAANKVVVVMVGICLLIGLIGWQIDSCRTRSLERKKEQLNANIKEQEIIANILTNQKSNIEIQVQENEQNKNAAANNFNASINRDSSTYKSADAADKFCSRFCLDSSCLEWRKRHPNFTCN